VVRCSLILILVSTPVEMLKEVKQSNAEAEMMQWHLRLSHIPFTVIRLLTARGDLPRHLMKVADLKCMSCSFCKATKLLYKTNTALRYTALEVKIVANTSSIMST